MTDKSEGMFKNIQANIDKFLPNKDHSLLGIPVFARDFGCGFNAIIGIPKSLLPPPHLLC